MPSSLAALKSAKKSQTELEKELSTTGYVDPYKQRQAFLHQRVLQMDEDEY